MALTYNNSSPNLTSMLQFTETNSDKPTELLAVNVENLNDLDRFIGVQMLFKDLRSDNSQSDNKVADYGYFHEKYKDIKDQVSEDGNWKGPKGPKGDSTPGPDGPVGPMGGIQIENGVSFQDPDLTLEDKFTEISRLLSTVGIQLTTTSLSYPNGTIIIVGRDLHSHNGYIEL